MNFKATHKTTDDMFEVEIDTNKGIELYLGLTKYISVHNTKTNNFSINKLYHNKNGIYFIENNTYLHRFKNPKYYLHELEVLKNDK